MILYFTYSFFTNDGLHRVLKTSCFNIYIKYYLYINLLDILRYVYNYLFHRYYVPFSYDV